MKARNITIDSTVILPAGETVLREGGFVMDEEITLDTDTEFTVESAQKLDNKRLLFKAGEFKLIFDPETEVEVVGEVPATFLFRDALRNIAKAIQSGAGAKSGLTRPHIRKAIESLDKIE